MKPGITCASWDRADLWIQFEGCEEPKHVGLFAETYWQSKMGKELKIADSCVWRVLGCIPSNLDVSGGLPLHQ